MEKYSTKNLQIATFLYTKKLQFMISKNDKGEVYFEFISKDKAEKLVSEYFAGIARVDPRELFARLNDLKDIIFNKPKDD